MAIVLMKTEITSFSAAERAIITTLIQAITTAAAASFGPIASLNTGLAAIGVTGLAEVVQGLQVAITSLQAAATINWTTS